MTEPRVSVVMGVYNGAQHLEETLESVLSQTDCDLEFIVVNDGSTDDTGRILDQWASSDARLQVIHQQNTGLTRALIRGCEAARGVYIARQDVGDVSLPGRFRTQLSMLEDQPEVVAVSCHTEFVGPRGEFLYVIRMDSADLNGSLANDEEEFKGPSHHGSVMMRRSAYQQVGGYRSAFYFAQDLDLWVRLIEIGRFEALDEIYYKARVAPGSISGTQAAEQRTMAKLILASSIARRSDRSEAPFLESANTIRPERGGDRSHREARGNYFIASCLRAAKPKDAAQYYLRAIELDKYLWRAWLRLLECKLRSFW